MEFPIEIKEHFPQQSGINVALIKKDNRKIIPPHPCAGAGEFVIVNLRDRGSDWASGLHHEIRIGDFTFNSNGWVNIFQLEEPIQIGPYTIDTFFLNEDGERDDWLSHNRVRGVIEVLPNKNTDYINVHLVPQQGRAEDNNLISIEGGGQITMTYGNPTPEYPGVNVGAVFCLKPEPVPPISCLGAGNRVYFKESFGDEDARSSPMSRGSDDRFFGSFMFRVNVNGVDYGVVDFQDTPSRLFGDIEVRFTEELLWETPSGSLTLVGGLVGSNYRFQLEPVDDNNQEFQFFDYTGERSPTVVYNDNTGVVNFCLSVVGRCFGATNLLEFENYDIQVEQPLYDTINPMSYRVIVDGVDYGTSVLSEGAGSDNLSQLYTYGDIVIRVDRWMWGWGSISLDVVPDTQPVHFRFEPVSPETRNMYPRINIPTVEFDKETGVIEFCLQKGECDGVTDHAIFTASPSPDRVAESFTELYHSFNIDGQVINEDHSLDLLMVDSIDITLDGIECSVNFYTYSDDEVGVRIVTDSYDGGTYKVIATPPPSPDKNFITGVNRYRNPTMELHEDGTITFCLVLYEPQ